VTVAAIWHVTT